MIVIEQQSVVWNIVVLGIRFRFRHAARAWILPGIGAGIED
jgi:hypothetical protein